MKKAPLYSRSPTRTAAPQAEPVPGTARAAGVDTPPGSDETVSTPSRPARFARLRGFMARHERQLWASTLLLLVVCGLALNASTKPATPPLPDPGRSLRWVAR